MDGTETTRLIRSLGISTPVIALTASVVMGARELMLQSGMDDYLPKPIIRSQLQMILREWLPPEKIQRMESSSMEEKGSADTERSEAFWDAVLQIKGLSASIGLERVEGQEDVYEKTLRLMLLEIEKSNDNLHEFLSDQEMQKFGIEVHGIKGSLANIGAMELAEKAFDLEKASDRLDMEHCLLYLPDFLEELDILNQELYDAFALLRAGQESRPEELPAELYIIFENLAEAFGEMDIVAIDYEMHRLDALRLEGSLKEQIEQITDMVMMMDYDNALALMQQMLMVSGGSRSGSRLT